MHPAPRTASGSRGFGLVELMVTLVVLGTVLGVVFGAMFRSQDHTRHLGKVADQRQMARTAVQLIEREARMAGSGWGRLTVYYSSNGTPLSISAINPIYGGAPGRSDALVMLGAWQASTTLTSNLTTPNDLIRVTSVSGFAANDLILVTNLTSAHLFQVTGVVTATQQLDHATSSPFNVAAGFSNWPAGGYATGSSVYKVTVSTYTYDSTTYRRPALLRVENGGAAQVVAYNVDGFRVHYVLDDGTWNRNPTDLTRISKIVPVVATRVRDARRPVLQDSVWAMIRPRTF